MDPDLPPAHSPVYTLSLSDLQFNLAKKSTSRSKRLVGYEELQRAIRELEEGKIWGFDERNEEVEGGILRFGGLLRPVREVEGEDEEPKIPGDRKNTQIPTFKGVEEKKMTGNTGERKGSDGEKQGKEEKITKKIEEKTLAVEGKSETASTLQVLPVLHSQPPESAVLPVRLPSSESDDEEPATLSIQKQGTLDVFGVPFVPQEHHESPPIPSPKPPDLHSKRTVIVAADVPTPDMTWADATKSVTGGAVLEDTAKFPAEGYNQVGCEGGDSEYPYQDSPLINDKTDLFHDQIASETTRIDLETHSVSVMDFRDRVSPSPDIADTRSNTRIRPMGSISPVRRRRNRVIVNPILRHMSSPSPSVRVSVQNTLRNSISPKEIQRKPDSRLSLPPIFTTEVSRTFSQVPHLPRSQKTTSFRPTKYAAAHIAYDMDLLVKPFSPFRCTKFVIDRSKPSTRRNAHFKVSEKQQFRPMDMESEATIRSDSQESEYLRPLKHPRY